MLLPWNWSSRIWQMSRLSQLGKINFVHNYLAFCFHTKYKLLKGFLFPPKNDNFRFVSANLQVNKFKNRLVNILPFESSRVCLQPLRGIEGSDYINASFIDGYRYRNAYIATQGPLNETVEDFWRMLWEHNSTIVVMLTKLREMGRV